MTPSRKTTQTIGRTKPRNDGWLRLPELRFVVRGRRKVLQQLYTRFNPALACFDVKEWRDVPIVKDGA